MLHGERFPQTRDLFGRGRERAPSAVLVAHPRQPPTDEARVSTDARARTRVPTSVRSRIRAWTRTRASSPPCARSSARSQR
ncbi:hypothetical protein DB32_004485 [Sandaracinus amylolyticus]|uniref:Uncharacterized protein n=1 Tax=Sandaracinus amylolyticus TaxID=927083 RepID=A0A0F6W4Q0_9BACT|nr:hypothetical protein DB32_004485 [Sandaracinus amylolyticus]